MNFYTPLYRQVLLLFMVCFTTMVSAQREVHFSQYMFQGILINPAYAGIQHQIEGALAYKSQWNRLKSTPTITAFNIHGPVMHRSAGVGLQVNRESFGKSSQNSFLGCFSYKVRLHKGTLALGGEAGLRQYNLNTSDLVIDDHSDPNLAQQQVENIVDLGFGMYYQTEKSHIGITAKKINGNAFSSANNFTTNPNRYYSLLAGKKIKLGFQHQLLLTCFLNYSNNVPALYEFSAIYQAKNGMWIGTGYRSSQELEMLLGLNLKKLIAAFSEDLSIGYAYDYGLTALQQMNYGSHEIMVNYKFAMRRTVDQILNDKKAVHPIFF